jgi:hypothetical protein
MTLVDELATKKDFSIVKEEMKAEICMIVKHIKACGQKANCSVDEFQLILQ